MELSCSDMAVYVPHPCRHDTGVGVGMGFVRSNDFGYFDHGKF